ncbi:MAG: TIGR01212 family radical SAM protein [Desulfobacterota bacterium]|nr:TIGR01212 family radical SAM protein [Thermodesulfobacteriota bacterium]
MRLKQHMPKDSIGSTIDNGHFCSRGGEVRYYPFSAFLKQHFGERVHKITLDAGLTCPNRDGTRGTGGCLYCDSRGSGTGAATRYTSIRQQAQAVQHNLIRRYKAHKFIAYFQSFCNTYAPADMLKTLYDEALALPGVVGLAVATRPDCLSPEVLELLAAYTKNYMVWLELGLQTIHDRTLAAINRGHTWQEFLEGYWRARSYPLLVCVHVIIGLPGESREDVVETARALGALKPDGIKIHSLYITKGTALERLYRIGTYKPLEREAYVTCACDMLELLPPETVIQRLTGDPDPSELVAPLWTLQKQETLRMIQNELQRRCSRQGARYRP